jgi:Zn-dependent metalloprotease
MKRVLILLIPFFLSACEHSKYLVDCSDSKFCSEIVKGKPDSILISDSDLSTVKSLFESNNLNLDNFLVYRLQEDDMGYSHVRCLQFINNLNVFSNEVIFHFNSQGQYYFLSGELISSININTSPAMCSEEVVTLFLHNVNNDGFYKRNIAQIENGCFICELGYYDLNIGTSNEIQKFKLAWRIRPKGLDYPYAYINDTDHTLIYYDNGIRF